MNKNTTPPPKTRAQLWEEILNEYTDEELAEIDRQLAMGVKQPMPPAEEGPKAK